MSRKWYFILFLAMFAAEAAILKFFEKNLFIRGFIGDVLAVIFLYALIMSVVKIKKTYVIVFSYLTGIILEIGQYYNFAKIIGMENNKVFTVLFGSCFDWIDIFAYSIGSLMLIIIEILVEKNKKVQKK